MSSHSTTRSAVQRRHGSTSSLEHESKQCDRPTPSEKTRDIHGLRWLAICTALYMTCVLYGLDTTIAADVQGPVVEQFGRIEQLSWVGAGFPLGSVCVILPLGRLYSAFDIKWIFCATVVLFEVGSALCGAAPSMNALIIGRVIAGIGGSGIYLGTLNYFLMMTTEEERGFYMGLIGSCWGVGAILGPVVGGAFAESAATWRWAFYINLVIFALSAPAYLFCLPSIRPTEGLGIRTRLARLDFVGFLLNAGIWVSFLLALSMPSGQWGWDDGRTIATFIVLGATLLAYVLQQRYTVFTNRIDRAFPASLLHERTQILLYIQTSAGITAMFIMIYYIPIYFQFTQGDDALMAAVRLLPFVIVTITVVLISGYFLSAIKFYFLMYIVGGIFLLVGGALLTVKLDPSISNGIIYGLSVIVAIGTGLSQLTGYSIASLTTEPENAQAALSMQNVSQIGGSVIALAIAGQVFHSKAIENLTPVLADHDFSEADIRSAVAGVQSQLLEQVHGSLRDDTILALVHAMQKVFVLIPVAGSIMLLTALCMKRERIFRVTAVAAA